MFVFKAAVVGAGTMGGQIAQTIAAAGLPVVLKDIRQELVDAGIAEARRVTEQHTAKLVEKGKLSEEQGAAQVAATLALITGATTYEGFGDVDFVVEAVPGADGDQAGRVRRARRVHARPRRSSLRTRRRSRSPRSATRPCAPTRSSGSTTSTRRRSCR